MKAQVKFKDHERQFWLDISERRAWNAYCMAGGKESWISYVLIPFMSGKNGYVERSLSGGLRLISQQSPKRGVSHDLF